MAHQSQVSEEHSVTEGRNDNSSSSASVDVMNIILVAAECAPWSKTGKTI
jgi:starch synthase